MIEHQKTTIVPMLAVRGGAKAIDFYKKAFGAEELWRLVSDDHVVAGLSVEGAPFFLADESPEHGQRSPDSMALLQRLELNCL